MKNTIVDGTITYRKEPTLDEIAEFVKQLALEKILADPKALAAIAAAIKKP